MGAYRGVNTRYALFLRYSRLLVEVCAAARPFALGVGHGLCSEKPLPTTQKTRQYTRSVHRKRLARHSLPAEGAGSDRDNPRKSAAPFSGYD